MKVFVTGGTGLLGGNLIPLLLEEGHEVTALARSRQRARQRIAPQVTLVEGDLKDAESYASHLAGIDAVIHAGACYGEFYRSRDGEALLHRTNVDGTRGLLAASHHQGVRRFIHISSAGVLETQTGRPTNESAPYSTDGDEPYFESKIEAEKAALSFASEHPMMQLVVLMPSVMIGPGDVGPTPTGAVLERLLGGQLDIIFPGAMNVVDARDVAAAAVAALHHGESGGRYLIGGARHSIREIFETLAEAAHRPPPTKAPPPSVLKLMLRLRGLIAKLKGVRPPLRPSDIERLQRDFSFSSASAERELGVCYRPLEETLRDTARWFSRRESREAEEKGEVAVSSVVT